MNADPYVISLGIHISAGVAWLAGATSEQLLVPDGTDRLVLQDSSLGEARAIHELEQSLEQLLGRVKPATVALLNAGTSRTPPAATASRRRGWIEAAVMLGAHRNGSQLLRISHDQIKKRFGVRPTDNQLRESLKTSVVGTPPTKWTERAPALAAAIVAISLTGEDA